MPLARQMFCRNPNMARASEFCYSCHWRKIVLPECDGGVVRGLCGAVQSLMYTRITVSSEDRLAMHETPSKLWIDILDTMKLYRASQVQGTDDIPWLRFGCRGMVPISSTSSSHLHTAPYIEDWMGHRIWRDENDGTFTMYHMVELPYLVSHCPKSPHSRGILVDGCMRYGCWNDDGKPVGVYLHASEPWELIEDECFLELRVHGCVTPVETRHRGKYVLMSDQTADSYGAVCTDCEVTAMYIRKASAPLFVTV